MATYEQFKKNVLPNNPISTKPVNTVNDLLYGKQTKDLISKLESNAPTSAPSGAVGSALKSINPGVQKVIQPTNEAPTTTDNGGGGNGSGGGSAAGIYQSYLDQLLADQKAASDARQRALEENYNRALGVLRDNHNSEVNNLNNNADDALRQAYINYMKGQRNLGQNLANLGINGGATESVLANIFNTYGNNRNAIETERQNSLGDLASRYNESVANLSESYGNNLASVLEDYYNNAANTKATYANKIATALGTGSGSKSSGSGSSSSLYNYIQAGNRLLKNGATNADIKAWLDEAGLDENSRNSILSQIGLVPGAIYGNGDEIAEDNNPVPKPTGDSFDRNSAISKLRDMRSHITNDEAYNGTVNSYLNQLATAYGLSDADIMSLLSYAGLA